MEGGPLFASLLESPESLGLQLLTSHGDTKEAKLCRTQLNEICGALFKRVETLAKHYYHLTGNVESASLAGLDELYLGETGVMGERGNAEVIFGQVETQNEALRHLLKTAAKKLAKSVDSGKPVRLLEQMESDSEESSGDDQNEESDESSVVKEEREEERMRSRMERVMEEMDEGDDKEAEYNSADKGLPSNDNEDSGSVNDPIAQEMRDGFFDLNDMEAFADEEEEYLPDEAYGEEQPEKDSATKDQRSFHQKLREGAIGDDSDKSDDEDDEENELLVRQPTTIRRKKYRADDEIEALHMLYEKPEVVDDSVEDDDDVVNMTAADIFGKPQKKYIDRWNEKKNKETTMDFLDESAPSFRGRDDDSFDEDKQEGNFGNDNDEKSVQEDEDKLDEDDNDEELVLMKESKGGETTSFTKSTKQGKLDKQIEQLEEDMISEKPWQMKGEVVGTSRPQDSLLQSTPEFEVATKQAPIITVEHTADLEDIIKRRILDEDWDDVVPRELPDVGWNQKKGELPEVSQEKSKLGLGELYEREYLKKIVGYDKDAAEKESEEDKAKNEMKSLFANLCSKLDALSNYHFAPRPFADEAEVRAVTKPAVAMEEVLPLHVSDARGVAPEEVYGMKRGREGVLRADSEMDQDDRKRQRSSKKAARRKARKEKLADEKLVSRLQPGLGLNNPYEKRKMREELAAARARGKVTTGDADNNVYGKSTTFFKRMQNEAKEAINAKHQSMDLVDGGKGKAKSSALKL